MTRYATRFWLLSTIASVIWVGWDLALPASTYSAESRNAVPRLETHDIIARVGAEPILAGELLPAVDETLAPRKNELLDDELASLRLDYVRERLPALVEIKLIYLDAKRKLPKQAWTKVQPQIDKLFAESVVPALLQTYQVETSDELEEAMRQQGASLGSQRQAFLERSIASQFLHQQVKDDYIVSSDEALVYYQAHAELQRKPFAEKQAEIKQKIKSERLAVGRAAYLAKLRERTPVQTMFDAPQP
jgi:hypothetical protein